MSSRQSQRPKRRRVKLVGGGFRVTRDTKDNQQGGSMKAQRRTLRKAEKAKRKRGG